MLVKKRGEGEDTKDGIVFIELFWEATMSLKGGVYADRLSWRTME